MSFLRGKEGKTGREGIRNKKLLRIIELGILEDKITYGVRWYGQVLRINEDGNPKRILEMKLTRKYPRGRLSSPW